MVYKITRTELRNDLLYDALNALDSVMKSLDMNLYIVGALARDIAMQILEANPSPRRTSDLDVAIALTDWK